MATIGCTGDEIAAVMGCSRDTIDRRFAELIKKGHEKRNASLRRTQYDVAVNKKNATMLIWLGKQFLGQSDKIDANHSGTIVNEHRDADEEAIIVAADRIREKRRLLASSE